MKTWSSVKHALLLSTAMKDFKHPTSNPGFDIELNE